MSLSLWLSSVAAWFTRLPLHTRVILAFALSVVVIELILRRCVPRSRVYAKWQAFFQGIGHIWTVALLSVVYLVAVGFVKVMMLLSRKDLLDRAIGTEHSAWCPHVPNPLGEEAAARHQF
jgi:hypothetical protein